MKREAKPGTQCALVQQLAALLLPLLLRDKAPTVASHEKKYFPFFFYLSKRKTLGSPQKTKQPPPGVGGRLLETNMDTGRLSGGFPGVHNLGYQKIQIQTTLGPAQIPPGFMGGY